MKILLDENCQGHNLVALLIQAGHDVATVSELGLNEASDAEVLRAAVRDDRSIVTRDKDDFPPLHRSHPHHSGIFVAFAKPKRLSDEDVVRAIANIESAAFPLQGQLQALNDWT